MRKMACMCLALCFCVLFNACVSIPWVAGRNDFKIVGDQLYRRDSSFTLRAIHEPGLCAKGPAFEHMVSAMARVADVGGNTIAFDLCGISDDGLEIDPDSVATISAYAERAYDQRMGVLVRVLSEAGDAEFRRNAAAAAAQALFHEARAVYWIDGPDAPALAAQFKKIAPHLVLAAPENGDITLTRDVTEAGDSGLFLLADAVPQDPRGKVNFVLPGTDAAYNLLDEVYMTEAERTPWTPDNTLLSEEEREEGFVSLFNGQDLDNWWSFNHGEESFRINEAAHIEWYQRGAGALMSRERYGDFILRLDYMVTESDANSGVFLRAPRAARQSKIGFEFQIMGDSHLDEPDHQSTASVYDVLPATAVAVRPEGEWNEVEVKLDGPHYRAKLNGVLVQDVNFDEIEEMRYRLRRGFIGLQDHGDYVVFRNIRIKTL